MRNRRRGTDRRPGWLDTAALLIALVLMSATATAQAPSCYAWFMATNGPPFPTAKAACASENHSSFCSGAFVCTNNYFVGQYLFGTLSQGTLTYACDDIEAISGDSFNCAINPGVCGTHYLTHQYQTGLRLINPQSSCSTFYVTPAQAARAETSCRNCAGDPVNPEMGTVFKREEDIRVATPSGALVFERFYNSGDSSGTDMGPGWRHSYDRSILINANTSNNVPPPSQGMTPSNMYADPSSACTQGFNDIKSQVSAWANATAAYTNNTCVLSTSNGTIGTLIVYSTYFGAPATTTVEYDVTRDDGQILRYTTQNGVVNNPPGVSARLAVTGSGFTLTDDQDNVETYNSSGVLQSITERSGVIQTMSYDAAGRLSTVADNFGHTLTIAHNTAIEIASVTLSGGATVQYAYDSTLRLATVTQADNNSSFKSFFYGAGPAWEGGPTGNFRQTYTWDENL